MSLLTYEEALERIRESLQPLGRVARVALQSSAGRILAEPVFAKIDHPPFDNSGVDGFALAEAPRGDKPIPVLGEIAAGGPTMWLSGGCALRVLTGGRLPPNTFAVVMQEDVQITTGRIKVSGSVSRGENVRVQGEDFRGGDLLLGAGVLLNSGGVALLASQGLTEVPVFSPPVVGVLTTGDELVPVDAEPSGSQLRDSNQELLVAALSSLGVSTVVRRRVRDDLADTQEALALLASESDLVIVSGGASVGDYDYLRSAVEKLGEIRFHGVSVRPGKPLLFGQVGGKPLFGLPGNPSSTFVCFHLFVGEAVRILTGWRDAAPLWLPALYVGGVSPSPRDHFERVTLSVEEGGLVARELPSKNSQGLRACALCGGLARIPGGTVSEEPLQGSAAVAFPPRAEALGSVPVAPSGPCAGGEVRVGIPVHVLPIDS